MTQSMTLAGWLAGTRYAAALTAAAPTAAPLTAPRLREGLRSLGPWVVANGFCDMVKLRNAMARKLGYEDFYDYKVTQAEGFGKKKLFEILDTLLEGSKDLLAEARAQLAAEKGPSALEGWNQGFLMAGDVEKQLDPFFPFEQSVERWGRCFAKLGISYEGASMTLDLLDRKGKYSNG